MWIFSWIKLSWHSVSIWDKPGWLNWFLQFFCDGLYSFHLKGFYDWYAWSCSLCEGRASFSTGLISRKLCKFLLTFSTGFTSLGVLLLFPLPITFFIFKHSFSSISSNIVEVLSIRPSAVSLFGEFHIHRKDWLTYSGGTDRLKWPYSDGQFSYSDPWLWLPLFCSFGFLFFLLMLIFVLMAFPPLGNSDHYLSFHSLSIKLKKECPPFPPFIKK